MSWLADMTIDSVDHFCTNYDSTQCLRQSYWHIAVKRAVEKSYDPSERLFHRLPMRF